MIFLEEIAPVFWPSVEICGEINLRWIMKLPHNEKQVFWPSAVKFIEDEVLNKCIYIQIWFAV